MALEERLELAAHAVRLLLRLRTHNFLMRGADISFLSAFPAEAESFNPVGELVAGASAALAQSSASRIRLAASTIVVGAKGNNLESCKLQCARIERDAVGT